MVKIDPHAEADRRYPLPYTRVRGEGTVEGIAQTAFEQGAAWAVEQISAMFDHPEGGWQWPASLHTAGDAPLSPFVLQQWLREVVSEPAHFVTLAGPLSHPGGKNGMYRLACVCSWTSPLGAAPDSRTMRQAAQQHIESKED